MESAIRSLLILLPALLAYLVLVVVLGGVAWFLYGRKGAEPDQDEPAEDTQPAETAEAAPAEKAERQPWDGVEQTDAELEDQLQQQGLEMLLNGKHQELEEWLREIDPQTLRHGAWKLAVFYQALGHYHERPQFDPENSYDQLINAAQAWTRAIPQSRYAPVGLANSHLGHAWFMAYDGEGWAREKFGENLVKHFSDEINQANAAFADATDDLWDNPHFYATMLVMALVTDLPAEYVQEYFTRGQECRRDYIPLYIFTAQWHLPRRHGQQQNEWVKWLEQATADFPPDEAEIMYARVALKLIGLMFYYEGHNPFTEDDLDWDRVRHGGHKTLQRYPESTQIPSTFLMAAHQANDPETASGLIWKMKGRADIDYWPSDEHLETVTDWAKKNSRF
jgi:hypothetical protein